MTQITRVYDAVGAVWEGRGGRLDVRRTESGSLFVVLLLYTTPMGAWAFQWNIDNHGPD
jgi:hypothetical protein